MIQILFFVYLSMLELNSKLADFLTSFSTIPFISILADLPIFFLPCFLWGMWLYYTFVNQEKDKRTHLLHILYACIVGMILSFVIKQFVDIERPESYIESTRSLLLWKIPEKSFPSDHATISFAFTTALFFTKFYKVGYIFLPLVIIMNLSRIIVGVHWPLDIIAWSILGVFSAIIFFSRLRELKLVKYFDVTIIKIMKALHLY